jgi:hypothetical protein
VSKGSERKTATPRKTPEKPGRARIFLRLALRCTWIGTAFGATALFFIGLPLRLTVRDDVDALAMIFYASPWSVLAVCGGIAAWFWRSWRRTALVAAIASFLCAGAWLWTGVRFGTKDSGPADFRVAYWNCARPGWRLRGILPMAASWQADLLCFGESRPTGPLSPKWAEAFPRQRIQALPREILVAGPDDVTLKSSGSLGGAGEFQFFNTTLGGREVFVLVVDFNAQMGTSRRAAFERLYRLVDGFATKPLIVMGDFNTPVESVHFQRLLARLTDGFQAAGTGLAATWPMVAPVLSLDHILVNKHLRVVRCEHQTSLYSDHRAVIADLAWK